MKKDVDKSFLEEYKALAACIDVLCAIEEHRGVTTKEEFAKKQNMAYLEEARRSLEFMNEYFDMEE